MLGATVTLVAALAATKNLLLLGPTAAVTAAVTLAGPWSLLVGARYGLGFAFIQPEAR